MDSTRRLLEPRTLWLLFLVLCLGLAARFYGWNWDQSSGQHPDERHVLMCAHELSWPKSFRNYLSEESSSLNPRNRGAHFFAYGTLPTTILRGVMELGGIKDPRQMAFTGRILSTLADTAVIGLVFALGWILYRRRLIALLAAILYALAVLPIQHAHYFVVDPFANMFVALALVFLARAWRSGKLSDYVWTGAALGLALSCKISVATFGLPVALVALLPMLGENLSKKELIIRAIKRTALFSVTVLIAVRFGMPDAFSGFWPWELAPRWLANMREVINISTGVTDIPFTRQFYNRIAILWPWWNMVVWGLGLGLGISAWLGWLSAAWKVVRHRAWVHAIPVLWIATVFFHQGFTYQGTLRYFLPIYGCLCLLSAWWVIECIEFIKTRVKGKIGQALAYAPVTFVVLFTLGWALAFISIFNQPHTRVEASKWIYKHVAPGKVLACEHWDDWLPLPIDAKRSPSLYTQIDMPHYVADNMEKRGELLAKLNNSDYIIIASQKLRDSIPRMPHRYPFTISYYEGLEDGTLGFDKVAEFTRKMNFFGFRLSTRSAEEAFSVYDHPPVVIYKKSSRYNPETLVNRFNAISLVGVTDTREPVLPQPMESKPDQPSNPRQEVKIKSDKSILFSPSEWEQIQKKGTWSEIFDRTSFSARYPVFVWVLHLLALQLVGWALLGHMLRSLPDWGAGIARLFGLLIPCWVLWLLSSYGILSYTRASYWLVFVFVALVAAVLVWSKREHWLENGRSGFRNAAGIELIFWVSFTFFLLVRYANPDLWHASWGGEKPMEMTFLYGIIKSESFPPMNPWFAGGFINYYYFGFVLCGTLIKGLGILPEVGFNLCLATFFALACSATACIARALRPKNSWALVWLTVSFVMIIGNLFQLRFIWVNLLRLGSADHTFTFPILSDVIRLFYGLVQVAGEKNISAYAADLYWVSARAITGEDVAPVTEFPYWSFLYGDLHPHLLALPYTLALIVLLIAWIKSSGVALKVTLALSIGLILGFFWPTNTWDWPTYGALSGLVIFLCLGKNKTTSIGGFISALIKSLIVFGIMISFGYLAFYPFHQNYVAGYGAFERWKGPQTNVMDYLFIYGFFLFILSSATVLAWKRGELHFLRGMQLWWAVPKSALRTVHDLSYKRLLRLASQHPESIVGALVSICLLVLSLYCLLYASLPAMLLVGMLLSVVVIWLRRNEPLYALPALFTLLAFFLSFTVEYFVLVGDIGRMNTVFKFYYQVWVLFALGSAIMVMDLFSTRHQWSAVGKKYWTILFILLFAASLLFPITGTPAKIRDRFSKKPLTLDGLIFAEGSRYLFKTQYIALEPDLKAIRWLQDNIKGSPVILEMNTGSTLYSWGSRYSIHTGLPSIVGWDWHQRQQQAGVKNNMVDFRVREVQKIYNTENMEEARSLMQKYGVGLIVVGVLERILSTPESLRKFETMGLEKIYDVDEVQIYRSLEKVRLTKKN